MSELTDYLDKLNDNDLLSLFEVLEVTKDYIIFDDCNEKKLYDDFMLHFWKSTRAKII